MMMLLTLLLADVAQFVVDAASTNNILLLMFVYQPRLLVSGYLVALFLIRDACAAIRPLARV